jgi:hypothetical protein
MSDFAGVFNRLCYGTASPGTVEFQFLAGSTLGLAENIIDTDGMSGTRSHHAERTRQGTRQASGSIRLAPTPVELDTLLPLILGGTKSSTSFPLAESIPTFYLGANRGAPVGSGGILYNYPSNAVNRATFTASTGGPLELVLDTVGTDETVSGTFPSLTIDLTSGPYVLSDCVLTIGGTTYTFGQFQLTIDNHVEVKFRNSNTPTTLLATDRTVGISLPIPLISSYSALYGTSLSGLAVVATFTNSINSSDVLTFSMPAVQAPRQPVPFGQRGILDLPWTGVARMSSTSAELAVTSAHS